MPVTRGTDRKGSFYRWGKGGKKYYYKSSDATSRRQARTKAEKQSKAVKSGGY